MSTRKIKFDICVVGELNADLILSGNVKPAFGQVEKLIGNANLVLGSSSAIFACGAARLGLNVAFLGKIGDDEFGHFVIQQLKSRQVNTESITMAPGEKTGLTVILNRGNDRAILTNPGTIATTHLKDIHVDSFQFARHLHIGGYFLLSSLQKHIPSLFKMAKKIGLTTSLDPNYDPSGKWNSGIGAALPHTDIFFPNEAELLAITRMREYEKAKQTIITQVPLTVIKLGKKGAEALIGGRVFSGKPLKVKVQDTIGAGDSFDAGFVYGFLQNWDVQQTIQFACNCGSLSTQSAGGIAGQPTLKQALKYL